MADIECAKCAEPWDAFGVRNGDMTKPEAARFNKGEGCPCCDFGAQCSSCSGTGRDQFVSHPNCRVCRDKGFVFAWSPTRSMGRYRQGQLYTGYAPNVLHLPERLHDESVTTGVRSFPKQTGRHETRDGWVEDWEVQCPEGCASKQLELHQVCDACEGEGTSALTGEALRRQELRAARQACAASDEDPMLILEMRGVA